MNRIIIAGSRTFADYQLLAAKMAALTKNLPHEETQIVGGRARGADELGERWANEAGLEFIAFPAQWQRSDGSTDKSAGYRRNEAMAEFAADCDGVKALVVFWDGTSRGTANMLDLAKDYGLQVRVIRFDK